MGARLVVYPGRCVHAWFKGSTCSLCVDSCPAGAVRLEGRAPVVDESRCVACGACAAACPTGAIELAGVEEQLLAAAREAARAGRPLRVSCREKGVGVATTCINALRLEHYYILAAEAGSVEVDARCDGCPLSRGRGWERALEASRAIPGRVRVQRGRAPSLSLLRRAAIKALALAAGRIALGVEASPVKVDYAGPRAPTRASPALRRRALEAASRLGASLERPRPRVDESKCTMTGICAGVCPAGAITFNEAGVLSVDLDSCVSCGICAQACPEGAIEMVADGARGVVRVYKALRECPNCGFVYPASLGECPKCSTLRQMVLDFYRGTPRSCGEYRSMLASRLRAEAERGGAG